MNFGNVNLKKGEQMMRYDFDKEYALRKDGAIKWAQWDDKDILGLANADMDFKTADCIINKLTETAQRGLFDYHYKPDEHYQAIINWYKRKYDWNVEKEWILSTPGIWVAAHICFEAYTRPGDRIILQTPHFHPIQVIADRMGRLVVTNPMRLTNGRYELDFEDFERKIEETRPAVYFMVNLQNPTGRLFTRDEVKKLTDICYRHNVLVISDEVHANLRYDRRTHTPAPSVSDEAFNNTVILNSASKAYNIMDLTYCFMVIPNKRIRRVMEETLEGYSLDFATNAFSVAGTTAALSEEADEWIEQATEYLEGNLDYTMAFFERELPAIKPIRPEGSFLVWLDCRKLNLPTKELEALFIEKAKVGVTSGASYGPEGVGFLRMNFACPRTILTNALDRIKEAVG